MGSDIGKAIQTKTTKILPLLQSEQATEGRLAQIRLKHHFNSAVLMCLQS